MLSYSLQLHTLVAWNTARRETHAANQSAATWCAAQYRTGKPGGVASVLKNDRRAIRLALARRARQSLRVMHALHAMPGLFGIIISLLCI